MPDPCLITDPEGRTWRAPSLASADREAVRWGGFAAFARRALPHVPLMPRKVEWFWYHDEMCNHAQALFEGRTLTLNVNVPPASGKSAIYSVLLPAWCWIQRRDFMIMSASYDSSLAKQRQAGGTLEVMQSRWFQERWGDLLLTDTNKGEYFIHNPTGPHGFRYATTPGAGGVGRHCHMYILDDLVKPRDVKETTVEEMSTMISKANEWIYSSAISRAVDNEQRLLLVMQRLHEEDATGHLHKHLRPLGNFTDLILPFEFEPERRCVTPYGGDHRHARGELLIDRLKLKASRTAAKGGRNGWMYQSQYQQNPTPVGGVVFREAVFGVFDPALLPFKRTLSVLSVDATFGRTHKDADYVAIEAWGYRDGRFYCYYSDVERRGFEDTVQTIRDVHALFPAHSVLIEDTANGPAILETLAHEFPNLVPIKPLGGKTTRARAAAHQFTAGHVLFDKAAAWYARKASNLCKFPYGAHDDDVDATTQAILWMVQEFASGADYGDAIAAWNEERAAAAPPARDPNDPGPRPSLFL